MPDYEMDMTPMIDVVFLLIIFFMVVTSEITQKVPLDVPEADQAKVPRETGRRMEISVVENGDFFVGLRQVQFDEIKKLIAESAKLKDFKVYIRADTATPHRHVRKIMTAAAASGVPNVVFATLQEKQ